MPIKLQSDTHDSTVTGTKCTRATANSFKKWLTDGQIVQNIVIVTHVKWERAVLHTMEFSVFLMLDMFMLLSRVLVLNGTV